jgi:hypothetical protein
LGLKEERRKRKEDEKRKERRLEAKEEERKPKILGGRKSNIFTDLLAKAREARLLGTNKCLWNQFKNRREVFDRSIK